MLQQSSASKAKAEKFITSYDGVAAYKNEIFPNWGKLQLFKTPLYVGVSDSQRMCSSLRTETNTPPCTR